MKRLAFATCAALAVGFVACDPSSPAIAASGSTAPHCRAPEYRQFDFWLGDWDTYRVNKPGQPSVARNRVTSILGGCVLFEVYERNDGYTGESFTTYDATRKLWHQSWVTNEGELLVAEGTQQGKRIVLTGASRDAKGESLLKVSWEPQADGVREIAEESRDGGKTWTPSFDILFRPHSG
ncbi:hypothetical protein [Dokdonella soli]|uniref:DUF1579 domain-containing protein n=1 Tax=Dokdonella soli TaxID=529810 RepID=A0ABN1ICG0_9GAMM